MWYVGEECSSSCVYILVWLVVHHLIPCVLITTTTVLLVRQMKVNQSTAVAYGRTAEKRRVSKIVIAIACVFLIQEVPYALYLIHLEIIQLFGLTNYIEIDTFHLIFIINDIAMCLTFTANFCIYIIWNRRFRAQLQDLLHVRCKGTHCVSINSGSRAVQLSGRSAGHNRNDTELTEFNTV